MIRHNFVTQPNSKSLLVCEYQTSRELRVALHMSDQDQDGPQPGQKVRYDELERKEARLRPDQYARLSVLSRSLNRARAGKGERITENTLIRVGIDLLLQRETELAGDTETGLRRSVGL